MPFPAVFGPLKNLQSVRHLHIPCYPHSMARRARTLFPGAVRRVIHRDNAEFFLHRFKQRFITSGIPLEMIRCLPLAPPSGFSATGWRHPWTARRSGRPRSCANHGKSPIHRLRGVFSCVILSCPAGTQGGSARGRAFYFYNNYCVVFKYFSTYSITRFYEEPFVSGGPPGQEWKFIWDSRR